MKDFVVLHKIDGQWHTGQPTDLQSARTIRDGLLKKWPDDEIKIELYRVYRLKQQNGTA